MSGEPSIVERAFQLARDSTCRSIGDIRRTLHKEGYSGVEAYVSGSLSKQLMAELARRRATE